MANIFNGDLKRELISAVGIQTAREQVPSQIADKVVPVVDVHPDHNLKSTILAFGSSQATGSITIAAGTILNSNPKTTVFITAVGAAYAKDATCDRATGLISISCTPKGKVSSDIILFPVIVTTAQSDREIVYFDKPLELEYNTGFSFTGTYAAGLMSRTYSIFGYVKENGNI